MGIHLEDGKGRGLMASVSESNRLNVSAKSNPRMFYISRDDQQAFSVVALDTSATAGDLVFHLKNTSSSKNMIMHTFAASSANSALLKLWVVTGTAASGTDLTPTNLNLTSGLTAEADSMSGDAAAITGLATGSLIVAGRILANSFVPLDLNDALILGPGDQIAIEYDTGTAGAVEINSTFFYEAIDRKN